MSSIKRSRLHQIAYKANETAKYCYYALSASMAGGQEQGWTDEMLRVAGELRDEIDKFIKENETNA